ncbi:2Fe-2S iron-sulfur cluster-binding protein [Sphingopyxis sp. 550A]
MFELVLPDAGLRFGCRPGQSILEALRSVHHVAIGAGCHNGGCGVCKIRIVAGAVESGPMSAAHVTREERDTGLVLACRAYPVGDCAIEVVGKVPRRLVRKYGFLLN